MTSSDRQQTPMKHVGSETDSLAPPQAAASAALIRWLLQEHQIPRINIYGNDFTPGYSPGRDQLSGQTLRPGAFASYHHRLGRG
jgi:hypothetical protein